MPDLDGAGDPSDVARVDSVGGVGIDGAQALVDGDWAVPLRDGFQVLPERVIGGYGRGAPPLDESPYVLPRAPNGDRGCAARCGVGNGGAGQTEERRQAECRRPTKATPGGPCARRSHRPWGRLWAFMNNAG